MCPALCALPLPIPPPLLLSQSTNSFSVLDFISLTVASYKERTCDLGTTNTKGLTELYWSYWQGKDQ